jgi:nucleoside-diphosphate-sugar epimerase
VLAAVAVALGITPVVEDAPPRVGDLLRCVLDPSRLEARGWRAQVSFEEGMASTARSV